jgi:anti-sigma B factor antagonist
LQDASHVTETFEAPEFAIDAGRDGTAATFAVKGELDIATAPELRTAIAALAPGYEELVIDLSECSFLASSGISIVLEENRRSAAAGFRLVVVKPPPEVQRIFELTSLDEVITFREA